MNQKVFTSEAVGHGHPDIIADTISDSVLDRCLDLNPDARVAIETLVVGNHVIVAGEIADVALTIEDIDNVIHEVVNLNDSPGIKLFKSKDLVITQEVRQQSVEIARGVVENLGAGDQGTMFGFSCTDNEDMLPMPIFLARRLANFLCSHKTHPKQVASPITEAEAIVDNIFKDCKTQFTLEYNDKTKRFGKVKHVVCSIHHDETHDITTLRSYLRGTIIALVNQLYPESGIENAKFHINPTGSFLSGGPDADTGLTGRKLIATTYGGFAHEGGGAKSGKDSSKVDRSAALYLRWLANRIVKQERLADLVELQVGYAIGEAQPMSVSIVQLDKPENEAAIEEFLMAQDFTPQGMIGQLRLKEERYRDAAMFGHFGKQPNGHVYSWETV